MLAKIFMITTVSFASSLVGHLKRTTMQTFIACLQNKIAT